MAFAWQIRGTRTALAGVIALALLVVPSPQPAGADPSEWTTRFLWQSPEPESSYMEDVSCSGRGGCFAVGSRRSAESDTPTPAIEAWDGVEWSPVPSPDPAGSTGGSQGAVLKSVWCASPVDCIAVGHYTGPGILGPLAEHWDGSEWAIVPVPLPSGASFGRLHGVACASVDDCAAVGSFYEGDNTGYTLAVRWDGDQWTVEPTPSPAGSLSVSLDAVSCASATACMAVGFHEVEPPSPYGNWEINNYRTLAMRWDGEQWTRETTVDPLDKGNDPRLLDVACPSADTCVAVGRFWHRYAATEPLVEHWAGDEWSMAAVPRPAGSNGAALEDISCVSASSCTATGSYQSRFGSDRGSPETDVHETLGVRWNGATWHPLEIGGFPDHPGWWRARWLTGVSCWASDACVAVGRSHSKPTGSVDGISATFAKHERMVESNEPEPPPAPERLTPPPAPEPPPAPSQLSAIGFDLLRTTQGCDGRLIVSLWAPVAGTFEGTATASLLGRGTPRHRRGAGGQKVQCGPRPAPARRPSPSGRGTGEPAPLAYGHGTAEAVGGEVVRLTVLPSTGARRAIENRRRLLVRLSISYQPAGGGPGSDATVFLRR